MLCTCLCRENLRLNIKAMMTSDSDTIRQRATILGTQIISKASARRLGIVTQIWLDVDQRRVMGVSVAERFLPGTPIGLGESDYMSLERASLLGPDAILVDDESVLEDILVTEKYTTLIGHEVVTESGELLGKVRDFKFEPDTGDLLYIIVSSLGNPIIPAALVSTYEFDVNEIIAVGRDRIIVTEGMEERLTQLTKGVLEKLGLGKPPWEQEFEDDYLPPPTISGNALGTGRSNSPYQPVQQRPLYRREESWEEEDNWQDERIPVSPPPRRQARVQPAPPPRPTVRDEEYDDDYYEEDDYEERYEDSYGERYKQGKPPVSNSRARDDGYEDDYEDDYEDEKPSREIRKKEDEQSFKETRKQEIKDVWSDEPIKIPDQMKQRQPEEELEEI